MSITKRIDAITNIPDTFRSELPPIPRAAKIELTSRCDYACTFCATSRSDRPKHDINRDEFERVLVELRQAGVEEIGMFYLGESFLVPWLPDAIRFARDTGFSYIFLTTNGSATTPERVRQCMEAGLTSLKFSLNYADEQHFKEVAKVKASFYHAARSNIVAARAVRDVNGFKCGLYGSYIEYDGEQNERMQMRLDEDRRYLDEVYALPLYTQANQSVTRDGWEWTAGNMERVGALVAPLPCWSIFNEAHITADLKLSACCFDHDGRFAMGDLRTHSFVECWHSETFQRLRAAHLGKSVLGTVCETCTAG
jgi:hypothetical protein